MRVVFGIGKHMWVWEAEFNHARIQGTSEQVTEGNEHVGLDPHSTVSCHAEISPHAVGVYGQRKMGFYGSEAAGNGEVG